MITQHKRPELNGILGDRSRRSLIINVPRDISTIVKKRFFLDCVILLKRGNFQKLHYRKRLLKHGSNHVRKKRLKAALIE
ncbi:hypothetical protein EUCA11A_33390 [Eubacterium callanderi]|nr:hypothetical protein EUCA2A_33390 [Eubacterium callanderi]WPK73449.1 hypothetical protein EUCA11A_33390 [Eubacterium callanderi]